tara:strand:+ start:69 stop:575 length:507 start_codon:yes stop_codon:yes gene_type:complete
MAQYIFETTGLPYNGRVVNIGGDLFSTDGITLEGFSQKVIINESEQKVIQNQEDEITFFQVGDGSKFGRLRFFRDKNSITTEISNGTPLHHHTVPAVGDGEFMTQHSMDGSVSVFSQNQVNFNVIGNQQSSVTPRSGQRGGGNQTPPPSNNNNQMSQDGGNTGGGGTY